MRLTQKRKNLLLAGEFYAKYLKIHNYDVTVCIVFKHSLVKNKGVYAQVSHKTTHRLNIEFDSKLPSELGLQKLAHEFVHVKQYITGKLAQNNKGEQLWNGKTVEDGIVYHKHPWEMEAMKKEVCMLHAFTFWANQK